jgi:hypothetical protein
MAEDLSTLAQPYALYLPAMQSNSALKLANPIAKIGDAERTRRFTARELNWFEPGNKHWSYKWCLASAGHMASSKKENAITNRHPDTVVLGDSGGYQIATGALTETKSWMPYQGEPDKVIKLWRDSAVKRQIIRWLDMHATYAMTIDMPLWVGMPKNADRSPFHRCSERQLIEMSVENLEYLDDARDRHTGAKYLNVLQGFSPVAGDMSGSMASEERWFDAVKAFELQGWSLGGDVGWRGGIYRVLRRILILRDAGLLDSPRDWLHVLGVSQMTWAVFLSAIQRGIRAHVNESFTVSFDSATPYLMAGNFQQYALAPKISRNINDWVLRHKVLPMGYAVANAANKQPFGEPSPIASKLTLQEFNPRKGDFTRKTTDDLSDEVLCNHNVYIYLKAFLGANSAVFAGVGEAPPELKDAAGFIENLFSKRDWSSDLEARKESLQAILNRSGPMPEFDDIR